nr:CpxP family protein [Thaumasiovibrio subtropicus]
MKKRTILATAIALPLVMTSATAVAFGGGHQGGKGQCQANPHKMLRQLDLTAEQKTELKALRETHRAEMKEDRQNNRDTRQAHREAMQALMLSADFDEVAAEALAAEMSERHQQRQVEMMSKRHQMLSILTDEQKTQLTELQEKRFERCQQKMESRGGNRQA